ncbi:energy transducer TonB [Halomonas cerina]|uniref:Protein TonB n=1 Tax=Halomonas cerina TaxID=447424 RepID=A0A839V351_9GAMM|nr:energy transducer TonB [Halomonas cerina]MBB3190123.1 protein TonB [Halomonas cerina]
MAALITDPIRYAPVSRAYRHWLAGTLAVLLHLAVIGGVASRPFALPPAERTSLDVVLVTHASRTAVTAEAIAEADQQAAGEGQKAKEEQLAPADAPAPTPAAEAPAAPAVSEALPKEVADESTEPAAETPQAAKAPPEPRESAPPSPAEPAASAPAASGRDLLAQATRNIREQGFSPGQAGEASEAPRSAAQQAAEARYIDDWTRRVEDYGNRVHPAPPQLEGQLRIRVVIGRNGQVRQAEVVQSSGHAELDQAALDTVHGAAPYRPFDRGMGHLDSLSITRVWRFGEGNHYGVR